MFQIKICGITSAADAEVALTAGADAIGLNFYAKSPRLIDVATARQIASTVEQHKDRAAIVGVFVNATPAEIRATRDAVWVDLIQLSGDESVDMLAELASLGVSPASVIRAFRVPPGGEEAARGYLDDCRRLECLPGMILWDAYDATQYGGTGRVADWDLAARWVAAGASPPLALAGGLRPENVGRAIQLVRPAAVDTASGVETSPGRKDAVAVRQFITAARVAFDNLAPGD
ncbi:MAG TPA: phosphoribosylanthranilate isomerase [Pirellulales bacterium]|jgi:phosphoribosylanthranilate isomerase